MNNNQGMEELIKLLKTVSHYSRGKISKYEEVLRSWDKSYSIHLLTSHDDQLLQQTCEFLSGNFEEEMDDPERIMDEWIFDSKIAYHALSDGDGKVIGAVNSSYMPLENAESMLAVWYVAVSPDHRGKRLAKELYQSMYQFALDRANEENSTLKAIVGEASHHDFKTIEQLLRRDEIARKRVYYQSAAEVKEVPYLSPPLQWDAETGAPLEEAQANHLMIKLTNGREQMPAPELLQMINAIYSDSYFPRSDDFRNKEAYVKAFAQVENYLKTIETALAGAVNGEVFLR